MKKVLSFVLSLLMVLSISACATNLNVDVKSNISSVDKELLLTEKTTQYFSDEQVPEDVVKNILEAGRNATSAINKQDWHFSAVTNKDLLKRFSDKMKENMPPQMKEQKNPKAQLGDSPLAIIVSAVDKGEYDAGLASQIMFDYAILSGYGAKIVSSPCRMLNENFKEELKIPSNMNAVAVVLIGKKKDMGNVDAITSASTRKGFNEVISIID